MLHTFTSIRALVIVHFFLKKKKKTPTIQMFPTIQMLPLLKNDFVLLFHALPF